ncbi:putative T7SS-secreted protein [Streptomyces sp. NPDC048483]|uniref:WXG100 family type VII secretion target n=1 Tax=Streptomyces sp. NPDC048483 TaxID=3154927 RepID=UPI00341B381B
MSAASAAIRALIPGNPAAVDAFATDLHREAEAVDSAHGNLTQAKNMLADWQGEAADGFRAEIDRNIRDTEDLQTRLSGAAKALRTYAGELDEAQRQAMRCLDIAEQLEMAPEELADRNFWGEIQLEWKGHGWGSELDDDQVEKLVAEFDRILSRARKKAEEAGRVLTEALRPSMDEIMDRYQVGDEKMVQNKDGIWAYVPGINAEKPVTEQKMMAELSTYEKMQWELAANAAWSQCRERFGGQGELEGHADAFRHTYWNALMVRRFGSEWTEKYATAHEYTPDKDQAGRVSEAMDLHNNEVGRNIAALHPDADDDELAELVAQAVRKGDVVVVDRNEKLQRSDDVRPGETTHADKIGSTPSYDYAPSGDL